MRFHVTTEVRDAMVLDEDTSFLGKRRREFLGAYIQRLLRSDKVKESGLLCGKRAAFFIVDVDAPEELVELFGPEAYTNFEVDVQPLAPLERMADLFQQWAEEGR
jgi:hypothetical protein